MLFNQLLGLLLSDMLKLTLDTDARDGPIHKGFQGVF